MSDQKIIPNCPKFPKLQILRQTKSDNLYLSFSLSRADRQLNRVNNLKFLSEYSDNATTARGVINWRTLSLFSLSSLLLPLIHSHTGIHCPVAFLSPLPPRVAICLGKTIFSSAFTCGSLSVTPTKSTKPSPASTVNLSFHCHVSHEMRCDGREKGSCGII